jgi:hypothetical protein
MILGIALDGFRVSLNSLREQLLFEKFITLLFLLQRKRRIEVLAHQGEGRKGKGKGTEGEEEKCQGYKLSHLLPF